MLWEGLGRQVPTDEIIDEFQKAPNAAAFVREMVKTSACQTRSGHDNITRLAVEFVVWWSMQVHT
jgi:hypothetical protein